MKRANLFRAFILCLLIPVAIGAGEAVTRGAVDASPESVGMSSERLAEIEKIWLREIEAKSFPGGVTLLARKGKIVYFQAVGFLDDAKTKPMPIDAIFNGASMTKAPVSVAAMMLVEKGAIKLSDPIGMHLKEFAGVDLQVEMVRTGPDGKEYSEFVPAVRQPNIHDLLCHTSGIGSAGKVVSTATPEVSKMYLEQDIGAESALTAEEYLTRLAKIPLSNQPGTTFRYGSSTDVLGLVLERVTGKDLETLLKEMLFIPLKMHDTSFFVPDEKKHRVPEFYASDPGLEAARKTIGNNGSDGKTFFKGAAGLYFTVPDYFRFTQFLLNMGELDGVRLLSPKSVAMMTADHLRDTTTPQHNVAGIGPGYGFGLGFAVRLATGGCWVLGTTGDYNWAGAWGHYFFVDPTEEFTGVFMSYGPTMRGPTRQLFRNLSYQAIVESYE